MKESNDQSGSNRNKWIAGIGIFVVALSIFLIADPLAILPNGNVTTDEGQELNIQIIDYDTLENINLTHFELLAWNYTGVNQSTYAVQIFNASNYEAVINITANETYGFDLRDVDREIMEPQTTYIMNIEADGYPNETVFVTSPVMLHRMLRTPDMVYIGIHFDEMNDTAPEYNLDWEFNPIIETNATTGYYESVGGYKASHYDENLTRYDLHLALHVEDLSFTPTNESINSTYFGNVAFISTGADEGTFIMEINRNIVDEAELSVVLAELFAEDWTASVLLFLDVPETMQDDYQAVSDDIIDYALGFGMFLYPYTP